MFPRIHISIRVSDMSRSMDFYQTLLDEAPDKMKPGYTRFMPADTPILLSLMSDDGSRGEGRIDHLGIRLSSTAEVESARRRLEAIGAEMAQEDQVTCCWAVQDKIWLTDPDGHRWEIYTVTDEQTEIAEEVACCAPAEPASTSACCG